MSIFIATRTAFIAFICSDFSHFFGLTFTYIKNNNNEIYINTKCIIDLGKP